MWEWGARCGHSPRRVALPDGACPAAVAAGSRHHACACSDGRLFLWGSGPALQGRCVLPLAVDGAVVSSLPGALACTWRGTAFIAADGCVRVLGPNDFMQHGSPAVSAEGSVTFAGGDVCVQLMAGSEHVAAVLVRPDGSSRVVTWGWGEHGQLGNGDVSDSAPGAVLDVAAGSSFHAAAGAAFVVLVNVAEEGIEPPVGSLFDV